MFRAIWYRVWVLNTNWSYRMSHLNISSRYTHSSHTWLFTWAVTYLSAVSQLFAGTVICQPMLLSSLVWCCCCRCGKCIWMALVRVRVCVCKWMQYQMYVRYEILLNMERLSFLSWFYAVIFSNAIEFVCVRMLFVDLFHRMHVHEIWENYWWTKLKGSFSIKMFALFCVCVFFRLSLFLFRLTFFECIQYIIFRNKNRKKIGSISIFSMDFVK